MSGARVVVIGLDCLAPQLAFERYADAMPNLRALVRDGAWGTLRSCDPPITVPAWMVMATGHDPGTLGVYGFRHRRGASYSDAWTATAASFDTAPVWELVAGGGRRTCLLGFPPSYPARPLDGWRVGCFIAPGTASQFTYPVELKSEVLALAPDYRFDVEFRIDDRSRILRDLYAMTAAHFDVAQHLLTAKSWDLFWLVEIGTDRVHHAFWKYADPDHPRHEPGSEFETAIRDYYAYVDERVGRLLEPLDADTAVLLVSDHGAKAMRGAFAVNDWLAREGWLALDAPGTSGTSFDRCSVDWSRTRAWAWGGYYARIFLNVRGREAEGRIAPNDYERVRDELASELAAVVDDEGAPLDNRVFRPEELYRRCRGDAPDLMVYFDDLSWRAAGTVGWPQPHLHENDTGPDDAVHATDGCFVLRAPGVRPGRREGTRIFDVAPTILTLLGEPVPDDLEGVPCR